MRLLTEHSAQNHWTLEPPSDCILQLSAAGTDVLNLMHCWFLLCFLSPPLIWDKDSVRSPQLRWQRSKNTTASLTTKLYFIYKKVKLENPLYWESDQSIHLANCASFSSMRNYRSAIRIFLICHRQIHYTVKQIYKE